MDFDHPHPRQRLALGFAAAAVLLLALTVIAGLRVSSLADNVALATRDRYPKIVLAHEIKDALNETARGMRNLLIIDDRTAMTKEMDSIFDNTRVIATDFERLHRTIDSERGRELVEDLSTARTRFDAANAQFLKLVQRDKEAARDHLLSIARPLQLRYMHALDELIGHQAGLMRAAAEDADSTSASTRLLVTLLGLVAALMAAVAAAFAFRTVPRREDEEHAAAARKARRMPEH